MSRRCRCDPGSEELCSDCIQRHGVRTATELVELVELRCQQAADKAKEWRPSILDQRLAGHPPQVKIDDDGNPVLLLPELPSDLEFESLSQRDKDTVTGLKSLFLGFNFFHCFSYFFDGFKWF